MRAKYGLLLELAGLTKEEIERLAKAYENGYMAGYKAGERQRKRKVNPDG